MQALLALSLLTLLPGLGLALWLDATGGRLRTWCAAPALGLAAHGGKRQPSQLGHKGQNRGQAWGVKPTVPEGGRKGASFHQMVRQCRKSNPIYTLRHVGVEHREQRQTHDGPNNPRSAW